MEKRKRCPSPSIAVSFGPSKISSKREAAVCVLVAPHSGVSVLWSGVFIYILCRIKVYEELLARQPPLSLPRSTAKLNAAADIGKALDQVLVQVKNEHGAGCLTFRPISGVYQY